MTYAGYLTMFLVTPIGVLLALTLRHRQRVSRLAWVALLGHALIAVVYTTPWDNYLVANGVWWYDRGRVAGVTLGLVPLEEYCFFVLQTLLTGLWLLLLMQRMGLAPNSQSPLPARQRDGVRVEPASPHTPTASPLPARERDRVRVEPASPHTPTASPLPARERDRVRVEPASPHTPTLLILTLLGVWAVALGILLSGWQAGAYLALELAWFLPPIILQVGVGWRTLWRQRRLLVAALAPPFIYLPVSDALAIREGVWSISSLHTLDMRLAGVLPVEEFVFFVLTNILIVFGMTLAIVLGAPLLPPAAPSRQG